MSAPQLLPLLSGFPPSTLPLQKTRVADHKCSSVTLWPPHKLRASRREVPSAPGAEPTPSAGRALLTMAQRVAQCQHQGLEHDLAYTPSVLASSAEPPRQAGPTGKEESSPLKRNAGCCPQGHPAQAVCTFTGIQMAGSHLNSFPPMPAFLTLG